MINTGRSKNIILKTNQGVRQGCSISPTLFNIYIDNIVKKWKMDVNPGIEIGSDKALNVLLFADDLAIIERTEENLQRAVYRLVQIAREHNLEVSTMKSKVMAFHGKYPIRSKIIINEKPIEQVSHFCYLGTDISYNKDRDIEIKIQRFEHICGTINRTLSNKTRKDTKIKLYKVMATPILMYGSESWVPSQKEVKKIQTAEMRFLRRVQGCTLLDKIRNEDIRAELNVYHLGERVAKYRRKWKDHIQRMEEYRLPKIIREYKPRGNRNVGRPLKRWEELV